MKVLSNLVPFLLEGTTSWSLLGVVVASLVVGYHVLRQKDHPLAHLPGPKPSSFLFGNMLEIMGAMSSWQTLGNYPEPFLSWVKTYGGVVRVRQLFSYALILTDPKAIQHVFLTHADNYTRDPMVSNFLADLLLGVGVISANGALHAKYRKLFSQHFAASNVKQYLALFESKTLAACDRLDLAIGACDHTILDMQDVMNQLMLGIMGLAACGLNFDDHPDSCVSRCRKSAAGDTNKKRSADQTHYDFLDAILSVSTTDEAIAHTMTVLFADLDTVSGVPGFTLALLAMHPDRGTNSSRMRRRPRASSWLTRDNGRSRRPPVYPRSSTPRVALHDDHVTMSDGTCFDVPKGTQISVKYGALHRNPKYWTRPDEFLPERFIEHSTDWTADVALRHGESSHAFYYMAFGAGATNCVGSRFALAEMQIMVATLVSRFDFELTANADLRHAFMGASLHPTYLEMAVRRVPPTPSA
ncbi:Aste57867_12006 [Aphanomyces stellatus]|uniref:Aste57867_12006 protein n=1 Tax=Aphanomyces stellatus TaxID=120398 RepID=A0A485KUV8_9STRA|nr:hypothetical protein As57867_011961 [Aphanomyces stellatus]VFT88861.1 Aste57867_12006 [Aphanomyces stellatus]